MKIRDILLLVLLIGAGLFLTMTGCSEKSTGSPDAKISQVIDEDSHEGHGHEEVSKSTEDGHEGHGHEEEVSENTEKGHEGHDHEGEDGEHEEETGIHLSPQALKEAGIVVETLKPRKLSSTLELPGTVLPHPKGEGFVGSLVEGRIKEIFVDVGDRVSKGKPLCVIESPTVGEAEAAFVTASAELEFVKGDLERHKILVSEGIGAQKEQLELQARFSAGSSAVSATERTLHAYGFNEEDIKMLESNPHTGGRVTLRSPVSGNIISRDARIGKQVTPESDLFHIVNLKKLRVHVDIPEQRIEDVSKGIEVAIISQNGHHNELKGVIDRLGDCIEHETRTLTAFVTVDNPSGKLRPGAFVTVRLSFVNEGHQVLAVPLDAVFKDEHGDNALFVEAEEGEFLLREVETGASVGGWIQITSGVSTGERVVTKGAFAIKSEADKSEFSSGCSH
ncbi:MAG: efflux RND transporter periplasmic adaptor subunit [Candidatus Hatepunaea meridiana]|nr:efflux RND transporter periplasmic adaptor subunit [Candidatus Hatepunaea meridiana]